MGVVVGQCWMLRFSRPLLPVQTATSFVPYLQPRRCFYALEPPPEVTAVTVAVSAVAVAQHFPIAQIQADPKIHMRLREKQEEIQRRGGGGIFSPKTISPFLSSSTPPRASSTPPHPPPTSPPLGPPRL